MIYGDMGKYIKDGTIARTAPREGRAVPRQSRGSRATSYCAPSACGVMSERGDVVQPVAFPWWSMLLWGWEPIYRLMRNHPTLALARYIVTGPILASPWDYTWVDGSSTRKMDDDDPPVKFLKQEILPLRRKAMRDAIRAVDYGWQPFAVTWTIRNGMYIPDVSPLLPDATVVIKSGNEFAGLENYPQQGKAQTFNNLESWCPSLDGEAGYPYGRSRYENVRDTAWAGWLDTAMKSKELHAKISGIVPIVFSAPNGYQDDEGTFVNYADEAATLLKELPQNRGVQVTGLFDPQDILDKAPESSAKNFLDYSPIKLQFLDAGSVTPAVQSFISQMEYWDKCLFRGMLRGERAGLEAVQAGSRADSEQHSMMGAADSEAIDADLTESFQNSVVYTALRLNFGEDVARRLRVISTPLQEWKKQIYMQLLTRFASIPEIAISMVKTLGMDDIFDQMSLPRIKKFIFEAIAANIQPPPGSGLAPSNGKPTTAQMERLAVLLHGHFGHD